jgi:hypothetical protein
MFDNYEDELIKASLFQDVAQYWASYGYCLVGGLPTSYTLMLVIFQVDFHHDHLMELQMMLELALAFLSVSSCKGLLKLFNLHHHVGWCLYSLYPLNVAYIDWIWNYTLERFLIYLLLVWSLEAIFIVWPQALFKHSFGYDTLHWKMHINKILVEHSLIPILQYTTIDITINIPIFIPMYYHKFMMHVLYWSDWYKNFSGPLVPVLTHPWTKTKLM